MVIEGSDGRNKHYSYEQGVMIPVDFTSQIVPGAI